MSGVIDDRQALQDAALCLPIEQNVHRPDYVRDQRPIQRLPITKRHLLPLEVSHLKRRLLVQPLHALAIHKHARLPKLQADYPDAIALLPVRQRHDLLAQFHAAVRRRHVAEDARTLSDGSQGASFAQAPFDHLPHHLTLRRCSQDFLRRTSLMTSLSRIRSSSSFFDRTFSASRSFRRLASGTLMTPNLLRHR